MNILKNLEIGDVPFAHGNTALSAVQSKHGCNKCFFDKGKGAKSAL
ncbi:hypothetical protein [Bacteroides neonati]|nr:hypothetical protein [Bacteroides neonati]